MVAPDQKKESGTMLKVLAERLSKLRKSEDFANIIPELEENLLAAEAEAGELKDALERALFESPELAEGIEAKIAENEKARRNLQAAIAGAERRKLEAVEVELSADLERRSKVARKVQSTLLTEYVELHEHLAAATKLLAEIRNHEAELQAHHVLVSQHKRTDLIVRSPWWHLSSVWGEAIHGHVNEQPISGVLIPGYYPRPHPDGPILSRMKQVKL